MSAVTFNVGAPPSNDEDDGTGSQSFPLTKQSSYWSCMHPGATVPKRLILVRHGESEGNINHRIYETVADGLLHLTEKSWQQAIHVDYKGALGRRFDRIFF